MAALHGVTEDIESEDRQRQFVKVSINATQQIREVLQTYTVRHTICRVYRSMDSQFESAVLNPHTNRVITNVTRGAQERWIVFQQVEERECAEVGSFILAEKKPTDSCSIAKKDDYRDEEKIAIKVSISKKQTEHKDVPSNFQNIDTIPESATSQPTSTLEEPGSCCEPYNEIQVTEDGNFRKHWFQLWDDNYFGEVLDDLNVPLDRVEKVYLSNIKQRSMTGDYGATTTETRTYTKIGTDNYLIPCSSFLLIFERIPEEQSKEKEDNDSSTPQVVINEQTKEKEDNDSSTPQVVINQAPDKPALKKNTYQEFVTDDIGDKDLYHVPGLSHVYSERFKYKHKMTKAKQLLDEYVSHDEASFKKYLMDTCQPRPQYLNERHIVRCMQALKDYCSKHPEVRKTDSSK